MFDDRTKKIGQYEYDMQLKPLGRGRMSFIYRGVDTTDNKPVAIKIIALKDRERSFDPEVIKHDIHFLQQIPATHVVQFLDLKLTSHNIYIITECIEGETLTHYFRHHRKMTEHQALKILHQVALAFIDVDRMSRKHSDSKYYRKHGDLTPDKIMLLKDGRIKVADFGIPSLVEKIVDVMMITQYIPTRYFPYECPQRLRLDDFGPKGDIWSAGVILYEALHGHTPWGEDNSMHEQLKKVEHDKVIFDHLVSTDVQNLIKHMLKVNEKDRLSWEQVVQQIVLIELHHSGPIKHLKIHSCLSSDHKNASIHKKVHDEDVKMFHQQTQNEPELRRSAELEKLHSVQDPVPVDESLDPIGFLASLVLKTSEKSKPQPQEVLDLAKKIGITVTSEELQEIYKFFIFLLGAYDCIGSFATQYTEPRPVSKKFKEFKMHVERGKLSFPSKESNLCNAWLCKLSVKADSPYEKLLKKTIVLNDTIALKGTPLHGGSQALGDELTKKDAFVVSKVLAQGGEIVGKANCESLQLSDNSFLSDYGPVLHPIDKECQAGGACSGCAVILALDEADLAIANDFDGSGRLPAAYCGVYAMKPTRDLIPMDGITTIDGILDQPCLLSNTLINNALLLEALTDSEEEKTAEFDNGRYLNGIESGLKGMRIGLLEEGFDLSVASTDVVNTIRKSTSKFETAGASLVKVSNPQHTQLGQQLWTILCAEGFARELTQGTSKLKKSKLGILAKLYALVGKYGDEQYHGKMYKKALSLIKLLSDSYDTLLKDCDVLVMPTSTLIAPTLPKSYNLETSFLSSFGSRNTMQFNVTGHPVLQAPCGDVCGMPVGLTIVGKHLDEKTIYRVAYALLDPVKMLDFD